MTTIEQTAGLALALPPVRDEFALSSVIEPSADVERPLSDVPRARHAPLWQAFFRPP